MSALKIINLEEHRQSVNPQKENGYTAIANEIMDELCKTDLSGGQRRCLDFILRKTYGFNKKTDDISYSQFVDGTGLSKRKIREHLKVLSERKLISVHQNVHTPTKKQGFLPSTYCFNKKYDQWLPKKEVCTKSCTGVHQNGQRVCTKSCTTKTIYKNKEEVSEFLEFVERFISYSANEFGRTAPKKTQSLVNNSLKTISDLINIDGFEFSFIQSVLRHTAKKDAWWHDKVKSLAGLRRKDSEGLSKFQKIVTSYEREKNSNKEKNQRVFSSDMTPEQKKAAFNEKLKKGEL